MPRSLDDYVEVADRIVAFYDKYPEGSLRCKEIRTEQVGEDIFLIYVAQAFRTPDDAAPAEGSAWEPVPGKTNFTRDSELMNAETSAWGRAIAALGFEVKRGIASRQEVMNRRDADLGGGEVARGPDNPAAAAPAADLSAGSKPVPASPQLKGKATTLLKKAGLAEGARKAVLLYRCRTLKDPPAGPLRMLVRDLEDGATPEWLLAQIGDASRDGDEAAAEAIKLIEPGAPVTETLDYTAEEAEDGDDVPI